MKTIIDGDGGVYTVAEMAITGSFAATANGSGNVTVSDYGVNGLSSMLFIGSDLNGPSAYFRASNTANTSHIQFLDRNLNYTLTIEEAGGLTWGRGATSGSRDTWLASPSSANLQMGLDSATPIGQTFKSASVTVGTSNTAGGQLTFKGGASTGTATGGGISFQTTAGGVGGSALNSYGQQMLITQPDISMSATGTLTFTGASTAGSTVYIDSGAAGNRGSGMTFRKNGAYTGYIGADGQYLGGTSANFMIGANSNFSLYTNNSGSTALTIDTASAAVFAGSVGMPSLKLGSNLAISSTAPTVSSGCGSVSTPTFGTNPTAFSWSLTMGSTPGTSCVLSLPTAANQWICSVTDITTLADITTQTTPLANNAATFKPQVAWGASDVLTGSCTAH